MAHSYAAVICLEYETSVLTVKLRGRTLDVSARLSKYILSNKRKLLTSNLEILYCTCRLMISVMFKIFIDTARHTELVQELTNSSKPIRTELQVRIRSHGFLRMP
jgi:hypothetical protein